MGIHFHVPGCKRKELAQEIGTWLGCETKYLGVPSCAYIDTGVKIIIGVVIGGVILAGLYALFNTTIIPTLTTKITEMFSYSGT